MISNILTVNSNIKLINTRNIKVEELINVIQKRKVNKSISDGVFYIFKKKIKKVMSNTLDLE